MSGQMMNIDYRRRREQMDDYIRTNPPYAVKESEINWHALSNYVREKKVSTEQVTDEFLGMFKTGR